jgi:hypothetical protein
MHGTRQLYTVPTWSGFRIGSGSAMLNFVLSATFHVFNKETALTVGASSVRLRQF